MSLWQYPLYDLKGDVLFLDLDLVITGDLDRFFNFKPGFYCVIENWTQIEKYWQYKLFQVSYWKI